MLPITGTIKLGRSRFIQDIQIADLLEYFRNPSDGKSGDGTGGILDSIRLQVGIDLQENAVIDMNLGYMKLDGDCILSGTIAQPSFTGEVLLTEGYVYYLDRRFTIQRATLNNYNPRELDPVIDLEAQTDVAAVSGDQMETYTIILTLKGNVNNPQITFRSPVKLAM